MFAGLDRTLRSLLLLSVFLASTGPLISAQSSLGAARDEMLTNAVLGTWIAEVGTERLQIRLAADGTFRFADRSGRYRIESGALVTGDDPELRYGLAFAGRDTIVLSGGDLSGELRFTRLVDTATLVASNLQIDAREAIDTAVSIGMILVIVIGSRLLVWLFKLVSGFLILSERGPLRYIYRTEKNRTQTIHSLVLDILKYVIYFTALGFILSELGVNYTAYLASLSVIGLAIGFGSQGLVQDIVTGFFLVFEGQLSVGDMVEISGQIGRVRDMGLRMTRLENFVGQVVFIPNRNIGIIGRYLTGSLDGFIDMELNADADSTAARRRCLEVCSDLAREFRAVFIRRRFRPGLVESQDKEQRLRFHFGVWPGQGWVIDQQLIPRIRERLASAGLAPAAAVATICYREHEVQEIRAPHILSMRRSRRARRKTQEPPGE